MNSVTGNTGPVLTLAQQRQASLAGRRLSKKELEILSWARQGKTVWEISVIQAVSPSTVKFHLGRIYAKLQVSNRAQAVGVALKRGLLG